MLDRFRRCASPSGLVRCFALLVASVLLAGCATASRAQANCPDRPIGILFVGNSFTFYNNLPEQTAAMIRAQCPGAPVTVDMVASHGLTLEQHWKDGTAPEKIRSRAWHYVVLQEQGARAREQKGFNEAARLFHTLAAERGAEVIFYNQWARQAGSEEQAPLDRSYRAIARELGARVAPAGLAWRHFARGAGTSALYHEDGIHASAEGTYLAALVLAAGITGQVPDEPPLALSVPAVDIRLGRVRGDGSRDTVTLSPEERSRLVEAARRALAEAAAPPA